MKNKYLKTVAMLLGFCCLSLTALFSPVATVTADAAFFGPTVQPYSNVTEWHYKIENGKLYKRLYDTTEHRWLTDWIYVCDYPG